MNLFERIRRWLDRSEAPAAADPEDLHTGAPEDPAVSTGLDRPFPDAGPLADPPERPLG